MTNPSPSTDPFDGWQQARLIPAPGGQRAADAVKAASETVLAVLGAVPELAHELLRHAGAPKGRVRTFTALSLEDGQTGRNVRPDGAIVVERGDQQWRCLVHARTGTDSLRRGPVERLVRVAAQHGFDAVLTVSTEIGVGTGVCPIAVEREVRRSVDVVHLSWFRILTQAALCHDQVAMHDPAQGLLVDELVDFLRHPRSHTAPQLEMGSHWAAVRNGIRSGKLSTQSASVRQVVDRWQRLGQSLALRLSQQAHAPVTAVEEKDCTRSELELQLARHLIDEGSLVTRLRVPDACGPITLEADLAERQVRVSVDVRAPREGTARVRIGWLLRQLRDAPENLGVDAVYGRSSTGQRSLEKLREDHDLLLLRDDAEREPSRFRLVLSAALGTSATTFPRTIEHLLLELHDHVVTQVRAWTPPTEAPVVQDVHAEPPVQAVPAVPEHPFLLDPMRWGAPSDLLSGFPGAEPPES